MNLWIKKTKHKAGQMPGEPVYTGEVRDKKIHITVMDYNEDHLTEECVLDTDEIRIFSQSHTTSWIDFDGIHDIDLIKKAASLFELHPLLTEDLLHVSQRPKAEEHDKEIFVVLKMLSWDEKSMKVQSEHVSLVLGAHYVLSFQERAGDCFNWVRERIRTSKGHIRQAGADYLFYALMDAVVDHYFVLLEQIGDHIEALENRVMSNPTPKTLMRLNCLKREMIGIKKLIYPLREVVNFLIKTDNALIKRKTDLFLRDLYDHTIQIIEIIDSYREMLASLFDIYLSTLSNRMNEVMKVLTIFAAIFIPLTFIVGIYGMNFDYMPELHWKYGYFGVWGLMLSLGVGMVGWFKKKKWL